MKLSDHQANFLIDLATLIQIAYVRGYKLTGGELYRNPQLQPYYVELGLSWTNNSRHAKRLAVDLNLFSGGTWDKGVYSGGEYQTKTEAYRELGEVWEELSPYNVWAVRRSNGTITDGNHFERRTKKRGENGGNSET